MAALLLRPLTHGAVVAIASPPLPGRHSSSSSPFQQSASLTAHTAPFSTRLRFSQQQQRLLQLHTNAVQGAVLGVEPDLNEDYVEGEEYKTAGSDTQKFDFPYGKADGAHTWHKGDDNVTSVRLMAEEFFEAVSKQIKDAGGPNDHPGQAIISWLFLPVIFSGMAFGVQPEYLFFVTALFIFAFIGIEMAKPDKPSNFEYDPNFPGPGYKP